MKALKADLRSDSDVVVFAADINDPAFAQAMAGRLDQRCRTSTDPRPAPRRAEVRGGRRITTAASAAN